MKIKSRFSKEGLDYRKIIARRRKGLLQQGEEDYWNRGNAPTISSAGASRVR